MTDEDTEAEEAQVAWYEGQRLRKVLSQDTLMRRMLAMMDELEVMIDMFGADSTNANDKRTKSRPLWFALTPANQAEIQDSATNRGL
jgi:hypothetical protein